MPKEEQGKTELFNSGRKARKMPSDHEKIRIRIKRKAPEKVQYRRNRSHGKGYSHFLEATTLKRASLHERNESQ